MDSWPFLLLALSTVAVACEGTSAPLLVLADEAASTGGAPGQGGAAASGGMGGEISGSGGNIAEYFLPSADASFQVQLSGSVDVDVDADFFVIDASSPVDPVFAELKARSKYVACYFSAGSYEPWREDADDFSSSVRGDPLLEYPNEEWLDVREEEVFALMSARMVVAKNRGCDAVYPSIVRPSGGEEGFMISEVEYAVYASRLAGAAHTAGLAALYSGSAQVNGEESAYDMALVFECLEADGCEAWRAFRDTGRPVFLLEFGDEGSAEARCALPRPEGWPLVIKPQNLSSFRYQCP